MIQIEIENHLNKNLGKILKKIAIEAITLGTNIVHSDAVRYSPIDTGLLRNSIEQDVNENEITGIVFVGDNTPAGVYAPILEMSDGKYNARTPGTRIPFLRPALYENREKIVNIVNAHFRKRLK